ncbi:hypothetical protein OEA41_005941 [Lepraria neglecta]|uniref:Uncharacterized protein n=1 Tax=Lepraria neglecta TaxID=209136 RepID=A0AAE0DJS4_9LECA|nr:hypothetical protein OEA41_005941 [Lepraria neglecta]
MVEFDMTSNSLTNLSASGYNADGTIAQGAIHYVPSFGPNGMLVVMGRLTKNDVAGLVDFGIVSAYDPAKHEWFNQTTTGNKPAPMEGFCTAGISSTNNTYEIFVYAGWGSLPGSEAVEYDTINILTLPASHWISVPYNPQNPRQAHTCNSVGDSQILTMGGIDSNANATSGENPAIFQSEYNSTADPFAQGLAIFDMTKLAFADHYTAGTLAYEQSDPIKQSYAQSQK